MKFKSTITILSIVLFVPKVGAVKQLDEKVSQSTQDACAKVLSSSDVLAEKIGELWQDQHSYSLSAGEFSSKNEFIGELSVSGKTEKLHLYETPFRPYRSKGEFWVLVGNKITHLNAFVE